LLVIVAGLLVGVVLDGIAPDVPSLATSLSTLSSE
jgi:hypothetical protein